MKYLRVGSSVDEPTKEKNSALSRNFWDVYAKKEYNTLSLDMNLTYIQETQLLHDVMMYFTDLMNPILF